VSDAAPLTHTYKAWALVRKGKFITTQNGRMGIYGTREIADFFRCRDYPGAQIVRVEVTVRTV